MVDYYALPAEGEGAWPGRAEARALAFENRARRVEDTLLAEVCGELAEPTHSCRFIPFVVMHEFEAMLFSDCERFANAIGRPELTQSLQAIRDDFPVS